MGMNFDPMTGEPLNTDETVKEVTETTEEVTETTESTTANVVEPQPTVYAGVTDATEKTSIFKNKAFIGVVATVAAVAVVAGVAHAAFGGGTNGKILKAGANTLKAEAGLKDLGQAAFLAKGDYNIKVEGEVEDMSINADFNRNRGKKLMSLDSEVEYEGVSTKLQMFMDDKIIQVAIPLLTDDVMSYNYVDEKDGYVVDMVEEEGLEIEDIDKLFASINQDFDEKQAKLTADVTKVTDEHFKKLKFKKVKAEQFEVNGKKQKCTGYTTVLDEDTLTDWLEDYKDAFVSYYSDLGEEVAFFEDYADSYEDSFDEVIDSIEDMDDLDLTFFLYKKQYAAIRLANDDDTTLEVDFKGGEYPMQNLLVSWDSDAEDGEFEIVTEVKKDQVTKEFELNGNEVASLEYNKKSGEYEFQYKGDYDEIKLEGTYLSKSDSITFSINKFKAGSESLDMDLTVTISKGSKIMDKLADEDDAFDVGNADEEDWEDLTKEFYEAIYENDELMDLF
ncbi:MAG: hypothetical protein E7297_02975 [Lachnospiraceae bacterium]|jgi:hypothetical protein|nr:hypothetical protein [Lachnospiraceae bacterium]